VSAATEYLKLAAAIELCDACTNYFLRFSCGAKTHGECDCPKCQGYCNCPKSSANPSTEQTK
jgi:hypothetical protein